MADRSGRCADGIVVTRDYRLRAGVLTVTDRLESMQALERVDYRVPSGAVGVRMDGRPIGNGYDLRGTAVRSVVIDYRIP